MSVHSLPSSTMFSGVADMWWTIVPLFLLPWIAGLASRLWPLRRSPVAAVVPCAPGITFLAIGVTQARIVLGHPITSLAMFASHYGSLTIVVASLLWASAWMLRHEVMKRRLMSAATSPSPRLRRVARRARVRVRELPTSRPVCMLTGTLRPTALVSTGALERLDDESLLAALLHERAHAIGNDPLIFSIVEFFSRLAFFVPTGQSSAAFRRMREVDADRSAAREGRPTALAAALIALARARTEPLTACGLGGVDELRLRLSLLLQDTVPGATADAATPLRRLLGIGFDVCLTLYPVASCGIATAAACVRWS